MVVLTIVRVIGQRNRPRFDRDAPFPFDLHIIENLCFHIPLGDRLGLLKNPVCQRALPMVDVRNDAKIADILSLICHISPAVSTHSDGLFFISYSIVKTLKDKRLFFNSSIITYAFVRMQEQSGTARG